MNPYLKEIERNQRAQQIAESVVRDEQKDFTRPVFDDRADMIGGEFE